MNLSIEWDCLSLSSPICDHVIVTTGVRHASCRQSFLAWMIPSVGYGGDIYRAHQTLSKPVDTVVHMNHIEVIGNRQRHVPEKPLPYHILPALLSVDVEQLRVYDLPNNAIGEKRPESQHNGLGHQGEEPYDSQVGLHRSPVSYLHRLWRCKLSSRPRLVTLTVVEVRPSAIVLLVRLSLVWSDFCIDSWCPHNVFVGDCCFRRC